MDSVGSAGGMDFPADGGAEDLAEEGFLECVGIGEGFVEGGPGAVVFDDADSGVQCGHAAFGIADGCEEGHFFCDGQFRGDRGAVFFQTFLEVEVEKFSRAGGAEKCLGMAKE